MSCCWQLCRQSSVARAGMPAPCVRSGTQTAQGNVSPLSSNTLLPSPSSPQIALTGRALGSLLGYCKCLCYGAHLVTRRTSEQTLKRWAVGCLVGCDSLRGYCSSEAEWRGCEYLPLRQNSLLLTANLFFLCSAARWVFQCQSGAPRLLLFFPHLLNEKICTEVVA